MQNIRGLIINTLFLASFFIVIAASFARYYYLKEFPVDIEVPCDPDKELCFYRDCDTDDCPPNGFTDYRVFQLPGNVLVQCDDLPDACAPLCEGEASPCIETICGDDPEDVCSTDQQGVSTDESDSAQTEPDTNSTEDMSN